MLPKKRRLTREEFPTNTRPSRLFRAEIGTLKVYPQDPPTIAKVGVVVSKKVARLSVARSALKRRAYSVFEQILPSLPPAVYILILQKPAAEISKKAFRESLDALLKQVVER